MLGIAICGDQTHHGRDTDKGAKFPHIDLLFLAFSKVIPIATPAGGRPEWLAEQVYS